MTCDLLQLLHENETHWSWRSSTFPAVLTGYSWEQVLSVWKTLPLYTLQKLRSRIPEKKITFFYNLKKKTFKNWQRGWVNNHIFGVSLISLRVKNYLELPPNLDSWSSWPGNGSVFSNQEHHDRVLQHSVIDILCHINMYRIMLSIIKKTNSNCVLERIRVFPPLSLGLITLGYTGKTENGRSLKNVYRPFFWLETSTTIIDQHYHNIPLNNIGIFCFQAYK